MAFLFYLIFLFFSFICPDIQLENKVDRRQLSYCFFYFLFFCSLLFVGVGFAVKPVPRTLLPGDVVKIEIEEIGILENNVKKWFSSGEIIERIWIKFYSKSKWYFRKKLQFFMKCLHALFQSKTNLLKIINILKIRVSLSERKNFKL